MDHNHAEIFKKVSRLVLPHAVSRGPRQETHHLFLQSLSQARVHAGETMGLWQWLRRAARREATRPNVDLHVGLRESVATLARSLTTRGITHALIGGVALSARGVVRATRDLDLLIRGEDEGLLHELMQSMGAETLQRSHDVSNYLVGGLRVDILYARRPYSRAMLERAETVAVDNATTRVIQAEDLIGLKAQALKNNPQRLQDRADIAALLQRRTRLDMERVREYFRVLQCEPILDELLAGLSDDEPVL